MSSSVHVPVADRMPARRSATVPDAQVMAGSPALKLWGAGSDTADWAVLLLSRDPGSGHGGCSLAVFGDVVAVHRFGKLDGGELHCEQLGTAEAADRWAHELWASREADGLRPVTGVLSGVQARHFVADPVIALTRTHRAAIRALWYVAQPGPAVWLVEYDRSAMMFPQALSRCIVAGDPDARRVVLGVDPDAAPKLRAAFPLAVPVPSVGDFPATVVADIARALDDESSPGCFRGRLDDALTVAIACIS